MSLLDEIYPQSVATSRVQRRDAALNFRAVSQAFMAVDVGCIVTLAIACGVAHNVAIFGYFGDVGRYFGLGVAVAIVFLPAAIARGLYLRSRLWNSNLQIKEVALIWTMSLFYLLTIGFALGAIDVFSNGAFLLFFASGYGVIAILRWIPRRVLLHLSRARAIGTRQIVLVVQSGRPVPTKLGQAIDADGCSIRQIFRLPVMSNQGALSECMRGVIEYVRQHSVDEILLVTDWRDTGMIEAIAGHLRVVPIPVRLAPDPIVGALLHRPLLDFGNTRVVELQRAPLNRLQVAAKRLLDMVVTVLALVLLLPFFALIAAVIALDSPGPVFFRQRRIGFNGREFHIYKFRTMRTLDDGATIQQACQRDTRVTRVGRLLRRFSIDELPQFLNILKGEMSLVGPRPHALAHDSEYGRVIAFYAARHNVKPGLTGWAQVNGWRGATPQMEIMMRRVEHDLWYVDHWSLWFDMKILVLTVRSVCRAENAY
jgi:Undecaprenyl-phosphate glucose phosphotransferase